MRTVRFLVPGTTGRYRCGGLLVELQTARLVAALASVQIVTYRQREADHPFLADLLRAEPLRGSSAAGPEAPLWIVSWGFDVPALLRRLKGRATAYHAHSSGYGFALPPGVPVLAVSRNTLGYWGNRAPRNPLWLVPNALEPQWLERGARRGLSAAGTLPRPVDVLVQQRKSSNYVLEQLVPALRARGLTVHVQSGWVDDLVDLFNSATVYLYDSADYWRGRGVSEGFGLPPIEALACGCVVFSSFNHALADLLEPGRMGHQIGYGCLEADVDRIVAAVTSPADWLPAPDRLEALLADCSEQALIHHWSQALDAISASWRAGYAAAPSLPSMPAWRLRWKQKAQGLRRRLPRWRRSIG